MKKFIRYKRNKWQMRKRKSKRFFRFKKKKMLKSKIIKKLVGSGAYNKIKKNYFNAVYMKKRIYFRRRNYRKRKYKHRTTLKEIIKFKTGLIENMFLRGLSIRDTKIIDIIFHKKLKISKVKSTRVSRLSRSGRKSKKKIAVVIGDYKGHIGLGIKSSCNIHDAFKSAIKKAKLSLIKIRRGHWSKQIGGPHTVKYKSSGKVGSVVIAIFPAPVGSGIKAANFQSKVIKQGGIKDCYTKSYGFTKSTFNTIQASLKALIASYNYVTN